MVGAVLTIGTWVWGDKYDNSYVERLAAGLRKHLKQSYQFWVFVPGPDDIHLTELPGCFARLRMFDPRWQFDHGITDRLVCLDLDLIITGPLDPLFDRPEDFVILQGANAHNPCPFNGSVMMLRAGAHPEVWSDFSIEAASKVPFYAFPDDQGWLWHKWPKAAGWQCGSESGIWSFGKRGWPNDNKLPEGARVVALPGKRDPAQFTHLDWVQEHWVL